MPYDRFIHRRKSIRLRGYDYTSPGSYFITIVTHRRACVFGEIAGGVMRLNGWGEIARAQWLKTAAIRGEIELDEFVVMPDHIHGIITIMECDNGLVWANDADRKADGTDETVESRCMNVGADGRPPLHRPRRSLASLIAGYKSAVTTRINQSRGIPGAPVWQRNYWEHIIRDNDELSRIREYIRNNPAAWEMMSKTAEEWIRGGSRAEHGDPMREAVIRFDALPVRWIRERRIHETQEMEEGKDAR